MGVLPPDECIENDPRTVAQVVNHVATRTAFYSLGRASRGVIETLGFAWVGPGATQSRPGKPWVSADLHRVFRPPHQKRRKGTTEANLTYRLTGKKGANDFVTNAHITLDEGCP